MAANRDRIEQWANQINQAGGTYHQLALGDGLMIEGDYDMRKYVDYYQLPKDLTGKTVLDVGTASGYFAIECARRGAKVTAIDIWDEPLLIQINQLLELGITYVKQNIYGLTPSFGQFDLVICGSLLLHLSDQFAAIQRIRDVCKGQAVVSTACIEDSETTSRSICDFFGQKATDGDYWAYWGVSAAALKKMFLAAGFSRVEHVDHFTLSTEPKRVQYATPHVVMTGFV